MKMKEFIDYVENEDWSKYGVHIFSPVETNYVPMHLRTYDGNAWEHCNQITNKSNYYDVTIRVKCNCLRFEQCAKNCQSVVSNFNSQFYRMDLSRFNLTTR